MGRNNSNLGLAYLNQGKCQKAIKYAEKGLEIRNAIGYQRGKAFNNSNLGKAHPGLENYRNAIKYYEKG